MRADIGLFFIFNGLCIIPTWNRQTADAQQRHEWGNIDLAESVAKCSPQNNEVTKDEKNRSDN